MMEGDIAPRRPERFRELDVFRGLAALWVVLFHYLLRYQTVYGRPEAAPSWLLDLIAWTGGTHFGEWPVFGFFMISGYVILWTIQRCRNVADFAVSRLSRLYPAYWLAVALTFATGALAPLPGQEVTPGQFLANLTMLQDPMGVAPLDGAYWSLLPELVFYVFVACVFAAGLMPRLPMICVGWMAACLCVPVLAEAGIDVPWRVQIYALLTYGPFFGIGIACFQIRQNQKNGEAATILLLALAAIGLAYPLRDALACAVFASLLLAAVRGRLRWIALRPLCWLGSISYALYVTHEMLGFRLIAGAEAAGIARLPAVGLALFAALALAALVTRFVEQPALHVIRRAWRAAPH